MTMENELMCQYCGIGIIETAGRTREGLRVKRCCYCGRCFICGVLKSKRLVGRIYRIKPSKSAIERKRASWAKTAKEYGWFQRPFYVHVVYDPKTGRITDSVSYGSLLKKFKRDLVEVDPWAEERKYGFGPLVMWGPKGYRDVPQKEPVYGG